MSDSVKEDSVSVTGDDLTSTWLSYGLIERLSRQLAEEIKSSVAADLIVDVDGSAVADLSHWQQYSTMLTRIHDLLDSAIPSDASSGSSPNAGTNYESNTAGSASPASVEKPAVAEESLSLESIVGTVGSASAALQAVSGLLALFKTETSATQSVFSADRKVLSASICGALKSKFGPETKITSTHLLIAGVVPIALQPETLAIRQRLAQLRKAGLADAHADQTGNAQGKSSLSTIEDLTNQLEQLISGEVADSLARGKQLRERLDAMDDSDGSKACLLLIDTEVTGGDRVQIKKYFFSTSKVWAGGVVVFGYCLVRGDMQIISSGVRGGHSGYFEYPTVNNSLWSRASFLPVHGERTDTNT